MNIFIIRTEEFLQNVDKNSLTKEFKSQKRCVEYSLGRFLVKYAAKNFYKIDDTEIVVENKKPRFKNSSLNFSISHSKNIVAAAFDENDTGFDIEEIKPRNLKRLSEYFHRDFVDENDFYRYWTSFEAEYKSQKQEISSFKFENYMCSVSFSGINTRLKMYELVIPKKSTVPSELINLKLVNDSIKNENAVEIKEINTASLEFFSPLALKIE